MLSPTPIPFLPTGGGWGNERAGGGAGGFRGASALAGGGRGGERAGGGESWLDGANFS